MHPILRKFIELFNQRKFFEAHEVLEELWLKTEGPSKDFYKGMIQLAAAFVHVQKRNRSGARSVFSRAFLHLQNYLPQYEGIDIAKLLQQSQPCFDDNENTSHPPLIQTVRSD